MPYQERNNKTTTLHLRGALIISARQIYTPLKRYTGEIEQTMPEAYTLTPAEIENLLTETIPQLPWSVVKHGVLYEAALSSHTKFYASELYKRLFSHFFSFPLIFFLISFSSTPT